jgi:hypothetical protein
MAGGGSLHAPGLAAILARVFLGGGGGPGALRIFARLADWSQPDRVGELAAGLAPALSGARREDLLRCVVEATAPLDVGLRARVLGNIGGPDDLPIVTALLDAVLAAPELRDNLPGPMADAVDRRMDAEATGEAERARQVLSYRALRAATATERAAVVDLLEGALMHPSPRVRLHAHRLLRTQADRARYLAATRLLLADRDPTTIRSAIRVLSFGRAAEAIPEICELLFHAHAAVRAAARDGLVAFGQDAASAVTRAVAHARPDRRPALSEVLDAIRST